MDEKTLEFKENVLKGLELTYKKLIISKSKENKELVYSRNGKIVRIKATDLLDTI